MNSHITNQTFWRSFFQTYQERPIEGIVVPIAVAVLSSVLLLIARKYCFKVIGNLVSRKAGTIGEQAVLRAIRSPSFVWCFAVGIYLGVGLSEMPEAYAKGFYSITHSLMILSLTIAASNLFSQLFKNAVAKSSGGGQTSGLVVGIVKTGVYAVGVLLILSTLGISIAPLLTALGVGGLAIALALKDTLENLFGGIYLLYDKVVKVGDVIRLESGQEGKVEDISWRTTRLLLSDANTVFIPNSKLAQSIVINFCIPTDEASFSITFTIDNNNDLSNVEAAVQKAISETEVEFAAEKLIRGSVIRFDPGFVDAGLCYTVRITVAHYAEQARVRHFLRKRIHGAFREAKVKWVQTSLKLDTGKSALPALN